MEWRAHIGRWGGNAIPGEPWMRSAFFALFALAAVLRFWRLWDMDFMHDEVSALVRLYPTLGETLRTGVIALDTHPPGVQVFEWLWTRLFGTSPFAVKLPFVLLSLAALPLLYRTAMAWTHATTALLVTALMATLQFSVLYGQLARPYAVGLVTTALLADRLTAWLAHGERRALVGVGIAALLSAYTHHFALLLAGLMGFVGLLLTPRAQLKDYLVMAALAVLLYLPNVPILLGQLGQGGLSGWLAPPDRWWVLDHGWWIAHTTWWLAAPLLGLLAFALFGLLRGRGAPGPSLPMLLFLGIAPMAIGIAYSVWRAPVIQHSMLLFSFPYLAMALLIGLGEVGRPRTLALLAVVAPLAVATLVGVRMHYQLPYTSAYRTMVQVAHAYQQQEGNDRVLVVLDAPPEQVAFHREALGLSEARFPHVQLRVAGWRSGQVDSLLSTSTAQVLVYGQRSGAPAEQVARMREHFPYLQRRIDVAEGQVLVLSRRSTTAEEDHAYLSGACPLCDPLPGWEIHDDLGWQENDSAEVRYWDYEGREFGILVGLDLDTVPHMEQDLFEVGADLYLPAGPVNAGLVVELKDGDSTVFYRTAELMDLRWEGLGQRATLVVAAHPADAGLRGRSTLLRAYLYNRNGAPLGVVGMGVTQRHGNPVEQGITGPTQGPWTYRP